MRDRSNGLLVFGISVVALFLVVSISNQFRMMDAMKTLSAMPIMEAGRLHAGTAWTAAALTLAHIGLCFILVMLITGLARVQGVPVPVVRMLIAIGVAHVPLLVWALYGAVLFGGNFEKEHMDIFTRSIARLILTRPLAYACGIIWLIALLAWQFQIGPRQAATLALAPVLTMWAVLSILGWVVYAVPK